MVCIGKATCVAQLLCGSISYTALQTAPTGADISPSQLERSVLFQLLRCSATRGPPVFKFVTQRKV